MAESENGGINNTDSNKETKGLPPLDVKKEGSFLRIDGMPSPFTDGKGTGEEPFEPIAGNDLRDTLNDARFLSEKATDDGRTIFIVNNHSVCGVDENGRVQLLRSGRSDEDLKWHIDRVKSALEELKERDGGTINWTFSVVDEKNPD